MQSLGNAKMRIIENKGYLAGKTFEVIMREWEYSDLKRRVTTYYPPIVYLTKGGRLALYLNRLLKRKRAKHVTVTPEKSVD